MNGKKGKMLFNLPGNPHSLLSTRQSVEFTNVKSSLPGFDIFLLQVFCMRLVTATAPTLPDIYKTLFREHVHMTLQNNVFLPTWYSCCFDSIFLKSHS